MYDKYLKIINYILNIIAIYFETKTTAYDEKIKDTRDYLGGIENDFKLPKSYAVSDGMFQNQFADKDYSMSCTAMSTVNAINTGLFVEEIVNTVYSGFTLWDYMVKIGKGDRKKGAYLIDAVKTAKTLGYLDRYYQVDTIEEIKTAIYTGDFVVTGSTKIDWSESKDGYVKEISSGYGHAFSIVGWSNTKKIGNYTGGFMCENSGGPNYQWRGHFRIPSKLVEEGILFNTKKALVVKGK